MQLLLQGLAMCARVDQACGIVGLSRALPSKRGDPSPLISSVDLPQLCAKYYGTLHAIP